MNKLQDNILELFLLLEESKNLLLEESSSKRKELRV